MSHNITQNYSSIVLNQNQVSDASLDAVIAPATFMQEFHLPDNYRRGTESGELRYPDLSGVQIQVEIEEDFARTAAFDYEVQYQVFGLGWVTATQGVAIGAPTDGIVWMTAHFATPIPIDSTKAAARWRIVFGVTPRPSPDPTLPKDIRVDYANGQVNVLGSIVAADLQMGDPYPFDHAGNPAFLYLDPTDGQVYFSYQQGVLNFLVTSPNPLTLPYHDRAYDSTGGVLSGLNGPEGAFNFRVLAMTAEEGVDFLGNEYRSAVIQNEANSVSTAMGADPDSFWLSSPRPSKFAVESLYFDVRKPGSTTYGHINLLHDPGFEGSAYIYDAPSGFVSDLFVYAGDGIDAAQLDVDFVEGRGEVGQAISLNRNTGTNNVGLGWPLGATDNGFVHGVPHAFGAWIKATAGVTIVLYADCLVDGVPSAISAPSVIATGDWQYVSWTFTIPTGSTSGAVYLWMDSVNDTKTLIIDDMTLWRGTDTPYPLDGDTPGVVWTGTPHESPSAELIEPSPDDISTVIDRVLIDPITPGAYFTVYHTEEGDPGKTAEQWENKLWIRIPQTYRMERRETHAFPEPIKAKYLKLEFSHLQAKYYAPGNFQQPVRYKKHPKWVLDYFLARLQTDNAFLAERVQVVFDALDLAYNYYLDDLGQEPQTAIDVNNAVSDVVASFLRDRTDVSDRIDPVTLDKINLVLAPYKDHPALRGTAQTLLGEYARQTIDFNEDYSVESVRSVSVPTPDVSSLNRDRVVIEQNYPVMFFYLTCRHRYREIEAKFTHDRAYFVGVREIAFLRDNYMTAYDASTYIEPAADTTNIERNEF